MTTWRLPLRVGGMREREAARRVRAALSRVGLLEKEGALPRALSTGEQQRVGIARAVVNRPKILLADEPTGNLDPELSRDIMALFQQFQQVGTTVIVASHDRELINALGSRIIELARGRLVRDGGGCGRESGAGGSWPLTRNLPWPRPSRSAFAWWRDHWRDGRESLGFITEHLSTSLLVPGC